MHQCTAHVPPRSRPATGQQRTSSWIVAPGDVSPGHMMFAPDSTNLMAPLSARSFGIMSGYWCSSRSVGNQGPSRSWKNRMWLLMITSCTKPLQARQGGCVCFVGGGS